MIDPPPLTAIFGWNNEKNFNFFSPIAETYLYTNLIFYVQILFYSFCLLWFLCRAKESGQVQAFPKCTQAA